MNLNENKIGWTKEQYIAAYKQMWEIRLFELKLQELYVEGHIHGTMHLCIGQEATAVGGAGILSSSDYMTSTHRNHGHSLAKGVDVHGMLAEILGRTTGINIGKGGSMHINDPDVGCLGSNGIVGGNFPIATGAALSSQMQGKDQVTLCYSGDGSTNEGSFHEALNLASIWNLPVIYFIENNQYGMSSSIQEMTNIEQLSTRAKSYGIPGVTIDGNDLTKIVETMQWAIAQCKSNQGPVLIEALTYRHCGHSKSDKQPAYRTRSEENQWKTKNDPIYRLEKQLMDCEWLTPNQATTIQELLKNEINQMADDVIHEAKPDKSMLFDHVYAK